MRIAKRALFNHQRSSIIACTFALAVCILSGCSENIEERADMRLSQPNNPTQEVLFVDDHTVNCTGVAPMQCMLVREDSEREWQLMYQSISGFNYEKGFRYELLVDVTTIENPPQDSASKQYRLIKIISKTATQPQ
ncbi:Uncharacterised protein [BD1-7 clade bacterium]|uniref:DUF4377 domain-containing protein n=1 Tax=BD1-7 clade bacterium TaxID=2029982 RepID=A0A5S9QSR7_9GAMM|nr:Uncharacterised protein [BD1-7 clade bacterium]